MKKQKIRWTFWRIAPLVLLLAVQGGSAYCGQ